MIDKIRWHCEPISFSREADPKLMISRLLTTNEQMNLRNFVQNSYLCCAVFQQEARASLIQQSKENFNHTVAIQGKEQVLQQEDKANTEIGMEKRDQEEESRV